MNDLNPAVFDAAADYLQEHGHTKNVYCKDGRRCALGALYELVGRMVLDLPADRIWYVDTDNFVTPHRSVIDAGLPYANEFDKTIGTNYYDVPDWNDTPSRKRSQVIAAFRKTATRVRNSQ